MLAASQLLGSLARRHVPQSFRRYRSTYTVHSSVRHVASGLAQTQPAFTVSSNMIRVLKEPAEFYTLLLDMIRRAEHRIFISSLYIGSAESELIETIRTRLQKKTSVQLHLQLDLNRSTRPGASSTAKILLPLLQEFPDRVNISMFRSPSLRGLLAKMVPPRFNEGWGTWHAKIYGVDDEIIISGANLNKSYFTNRQDRYIHFINQPTLAQYCFNFLQTISTFSYHLSTIQGPAPYSYQHEGYFLQWPDPKTHPHKIHAKAQTALSTFQSSQHQTHQLQLSEDESTLVSTKSSACPTDVLLFPIIQAGQFSVREEESALALLFRTLQTSLQHSKEGQPLIDLTSGYFGLYEPYQNLVLTNNISTKIIVASPKANGFFGSKGISGRIPEGYTLLEQRFMAVVKRAGRLWNEGTGVQLTEWERDGWTYHAKGIWVSPSPDSTPILTLFGSTNLNSRSAHIDTELSFIMVVPSTTKTEAEADIDSHEMVIRNQLKDEIVELKVYATDWKGAQRHVRFWTKAIVRMVKGML